MLVAAGAVVAAAVATVATVASVAVAVVGAAFWRRYKKKKRMRRTTTTAATPATVPPTIAPIFVVFLVVLVLAVVVANDGDAVAEEEKVFPAIKLLDASVVDCNDNKDDNKDVVTTVVLTKNAAAILGFEDKYAAERFPTPVHPPAQALSLQHPQKGGFVPLHAYHSDPEGQS